MRLTILAGLIMGVSLAIQSALGAQIRAKAARATRPGRTRQVAPWYIAKNDGHDGGHFAAIARDDRADDSRGPASGS